MQDALPTASASSRAATRTPSRHAAATLRHRSRVAAASRSPRCRLSSARSSSAAMVTSTVPPRDAISSASLCLSTASSAAPMLRNTQPRGVDATAGESRHVATVDRHGVAIEPVECVGRASGQRVCVAGEQQRVQSRRRVLDTDVFAWRRPHQWQRLIDPTLVGAEDAEPSRRGHPIGAGRQFESRNRASPVHPAGRRPHGESAHRR